MSQTVKLKVAMTSDEAIRRACVRMELPDPVKGSAELYDRKESGTIVQLSGWRYPIVISGTGAVAFDNYNGNWGDIKDLDRLSQFYVVESARIEAESTGGVVTEIEAANGDINLQVEYAYA
jgi:hypothetical protein